MVPQPRNRVRARRESCGLSQVTLAERTGLSRQSLGAIEAGRATPSVDAALRIARALDSSVEGLFGPSPEDPALDVELTAAPVTRRVALARVRDRWVGLPLGSDGLRIAADAMVVDARRRRARVAPLRPLAAARDNLFVMGCATGLGPLTDRIDGRTGPGRFVWLPSSSGAALQALRRGHTHVAGVHSVDRGSGDANAAAARRAGAPEPLVLITFARWEAGFITRADDLRVRSIADLAAPEVRLVGREQGAGARKLLESSLIAAGMARELADAAPLTAAGHLELARTIAMGAGDVGVATRDAALAYGLRFVPLAEERFDLVIPQPLLADARIGRLLDVLVSHAGRRELEALGYDMSSAGRRVAEIEAA